jgi:hypothetical protein
MLKKIMALLSICHEESQSNKSVDEISWKVKLVSFFPINIFKAIDSNNPEFGYKISKVQLKIVLIKNRTQILLNNSS